MTHQPPDADGPWPAELLARAGWPAVETALLRGLAHDLSGRASALGGLVELLRLDDHGEPSPLDLLREESIRLGETVELLRLLAGEGGGQPPEPLALEPLLRPVLRLHARHRGLDAMETALEVGEDVAPVRVRRDLLVRALLLLLGAAGWAVRRGGGRRLDVRLEARGKRVVVALAIPAEGSAAGEGPPGVASDPGLERVARGVEEALAEEGAEVRRTEEEGGGGARLELSLPPLERR